MFNNFTRVLSSPMCISLWTVTFYAHYEQTNSPLTLLTSRSSINIAMKSSAVLRNLVCFLSSLSAVWFVGVCIKTHWTSGLFIGLLMFMWSAFTAFSACCLSRNVDVCTKQKRSLFCIMSLFPLRRPELPIKV